MPDYNYNISRAPNQWNDAFEGLFTGLGQVGVAGIQKHYQNETDDLYSTILNKMQQKIKAYESSKYPTNTTLPTNNPVEQANPLDNSNVKDSQNPEDYLQINAKPIGLDDKMQVTDINPTNTGMHVTNTPIRPVAPVGDIMDIYNQYFQDLNKLSQRGSYGMSKAEMLGQQLGILNKTAPEYKIFGSGDTYYKMNEKDGSIEVITNPNPKKATPKYMKLDPDSVLERDGKYYAANYLFDENSGEPKTVYQEIDKESYDFFKDIQDKKTYIAPKTSGNSRRGGLRMNGKTTPTKISASDKQLTNYVSKYAELRNIPSESLTEKQKIDMEKLKTAIEKRGVDPEETADYYDMNGSDGLVENVNISQAADAYIYDTFKLQDVKNNVVTAALSGKSPESQIAVMYDRLGQFSNSDNPQELKEAVYEYANMIAGYARAVFNHEDTSSYEQYFGDILEAGEDSSSYDGSEVNP